MRPFSKTAKSAKSLHPTVPVLYLEAARYIITTVCDPGVKQFPLPRVMYILNTAYIAQRAIFEKWERKTVGNSYIVLPNYTVL